MEAQHTAQKAAAMEAMTRAAFDEAYRMQREHEVPFAEVDMLRHVNNVAYVEWAERIRSFYFAEVLGEDITGERGMIIARHDLHYVAPAFYRERLTIGCRILRFGTKSFEIETAVWAHDRALVIFRAVATLVAFDYVAGRSIAVPETWKERSAAYRGVAERHTL